MKAVVRKIGTKVCYTFEDERFFICELVEAESDLRLASQSEDHKIEVDPIYYLLAT